MLRMLKWIEFLSLPCSLTSGEYPLLETPGQSLESYRKFLTRINMSEDLQQVIKTQSFIGWSDCNMIRIADEEDDPDSVMMYWILDATLCASSYKAVEWVISYCGPSSLIHLNDTLVGNFSRLPSNRCPYLQYQPKSGGLIFSRKVNLPKLPDATHASGVKMQMFWVQVTTSNDITASGSAANSSLHRYGFFASVSDRFVSLSVLMTDKTLLDPTFPNLDTFISDPETFGFTASAITDISISARCPYSYTSSIETFEGFGLFHANLDDLEPMTAGTGIVYSLEPADNTYPELVTETMNFTRSALERSCGTITIRNESGNNIGLIDPAWDSIPVKTTCVSDYGSLTTYIDVNGYLFAISEGHIPWVGDAWAEYKKYSLAYDREAMEQSIDFANQRVAVNIAQSAANTIQSAAMGAIGGNVAGAVTGAVGGAASFAISTWATMRESDISTAESRATQDLAERRVQGSAGTAYNTGYGKIYCYQQLENPACIQVEMPAGLTSSLAEDYTACFGFPAEGLRSVSMTEGYYKGMLYCGSITGPRFDAMNRVFQNGFRFKEV